MRTRLILLTLSFYLAVTTLACNKPPADTNADGSNSATSGTSSDTEKSSKEHRKDKEAKQEKKKEPVIVPTGTGITVSLGSALGSKISQPGQSFTGTVAQDITVGNEVVIPKGTAVSGTVTDAKALGKFKGGALLDIRLTSMTLGGSDMQIETAAKNFTEKGKGKRTAVLTGGGAALGGIIGAIAGGGKGAAIGMAAGAGAGAGGSAFTGNKEIVLPAESNVTFELTKDIKLERM